MATKKASPKKKAPVKKKTSSSKSRVPTVKYETLKVTKKDVPFFGTHLTVQTFYWTLIGILVLILGLWIISLQYDVHNLYQQLETTQANDLPAVAPKDY